MTSNSQRALGVRDMPEKERSPAEQFRIEGEKWALAGYDYTIAEMMEKTVLERIAQSLFDEARAAEEKISLNEAKRRALMSEDWEAHIMKVAARKRDADLAFVRRKAIEIHEDWARNRDANARKEYELGKRGA